MKRIPMSVLISIVAVVIHHGWSTGASLNFRAHMQANKIIPLPSTLDGSTAQRQAIFQIADDEMSMSYKINVAKSIKSPWHTFINTAVKLEGTVRSSSGCSQALAALHPALPLSEWMVDWWRA